MGDNTNETYGKLVAFKGGDTAIQNAVQTWKQFYDKEYVPLRLEQSILHAFLSNEQFDLTKKNEVLVEHQKAQLRVIDRIVNDFYNKSFSSMRNYQSIDYKINNVRSNIQLIKYAAILVAAMSMLLGMKATGTMNAEMLTMVSTVLVLLYALIVIMTYRQKLYRNKYNWNRMYWSAPSTEDKTTSA